MLFTLIKISAKIIKRERWCGKETIKYLEIDTLTDKYENGFIIKSVDGNYGVINSNGVLVLEAKYEEIFSSGYRESEVVVKENEK